MNTHPSAGGAVSVLVIDDDAALRTLFLALLTRRGFQVECVSDGAQALERLATQSYSVVVLDLMMPVVSGFDVLDRFAAESPALLQHTVVTTGVSQRDLAKIEGKNVFAVLRKPFDIDNLIDTVERCARRPEPPPAPGRGTDLGRSVRKLQTKLPEIQALLGSTAQGERELLLRHELRQVVGQVAGVLTTAATLQKDREKARRLRELGYTALRIALARSAMHDH